MIERQPNRPPIPEPQHTPHEGGNGAPGIPLNLNQRAKPPPEGSAHGEHHSTDVQQPLERRGAISDCAIPRIIPSPIFLRRGVRYGTYTEEDAREVEQEWRENLRTWDTQRLERVISSLEDRRDNAAKQNRQEEVGDIAYEVETLRAELRQRE
jgi:hypothetical protein